MVWQQIENIKIEINYGKGLKKTLDISPEHIEDKESIEKVEEWFYL